jgi:hypothetical protein
MSGNTPTWEISTLTGTDSDQPTCKRSDLLSDPRLAEIIEKAIESSVVVVGEDAKDLGAALEPKHLGSSRSNS